MENIDIRLMLSDKGISNKHVAKIIGISPEYFSKLMSKPLSPYNRQRVLHAVTVIENQLESIRNPYTNSGKEGESE